MIGQGLEGIPGGAYTGSKTKKGVYVFSEHLTQHQKGIPYMYNEQNAVCGTIIFHFSYAITHRLMSDMCVVGDS